MNQIRVLIENADAAVLWASERVLSRGGFEVETCSGPDDRRVTCTLAIDGCCELAERADVIVNGLAPQHGDILASQRRVLGNTPVVLNLNETELAQLDLAAAQGSDVVSRAAGASALVGAVTHALRHPQHQTP